ncbi:cupredoxin domain-containing protein [Streptomyces afghaniensis]|uniref:cupredoxin domain-containing protein n=1 Tax=Streptomyces afghaniensis TaxID=66865 RepID=UPI002787FB45|nr:cupredoxin family copper-binding protein [Streptomyces afghaniensis]MDQ1019059.1 plastocyanin [Streptomyces afghaniensis]
MKRSNESDETGQERRRPPAGNRGLLVAGLGAALAAVLGLGLLSAVSGSDSEQVTGAAQAPVAAAEAQPAAAKADHQVDIMGNKFGDGKQLVVEVGQTVRWTNHDSVPHTVTTTKAPVKFDSGTLEQGDSWSYTFTKAGTYEYYCAVHPDMTSSVKVVAAGGGGGGGGSTPAPTAPPTGTPTAGPAPTHAPTGAPTAGPAPTGGTGTGGSGGSDEQCASVQNELLPILQHLYTAHLERSPGQQVQDALALDSYLKTHTVWVESILKPAVADGGSVLDDTLGVLLNHINKAHLEESPGQQVTDLLNPDAYVKMHTVWAGQMLKPTTDFLTGNC